MFTITKTALNEFADKLAASTEQFHRIPTPAGISLVLTRNGESIALHYHKTPYDGHGDRVIAFRLYGSWTFYSCEQVKFEA